jgi:hypothetical protein
MAVTSSVCAHVVLLYLGCKLLCREQEGSKGRVMSLHGEEPGLSHFPECKRLNEIVYAESMAQ